MRVTIDCERDFVRLRTMRNVRENSTFGSKENEHGSFESVKKKKKELK